VVNRFGADATRWYMYTASPAGSPRRFSGNLVEEGLRRFLLTLWNTYSFFVSYANLDNLDPRTRPSGAMPEIDRWLLSELNALVAKVTSELEDYEPTNAARAIDAFVDDLSNWYVRRSRRRFWRGAGEDDNDKQSAYYALYTSLVTLSKLLAPFTPFVADELWQNLVRSIDPGAAESVHLADWPAVDAAAIDAALNRETELLKRVASLGRSARAGAQIKVRQPVSEVAVSPRTADEADVLRRNSALILEELNAKTLRVASDESEIVTWSVKPNLPVLGKKYGSALQQIRAGLAELPPREVADTVRRGRNLAVAGYELEPEDVLLEPMDAEGYATSTESGYTVAVATTITPELADEGLARELVRRLQDLRREAGFELSDRITAWYQGDGDLSRVAAAFGDYIRGETLATELVAGAPPAEAHSETQRMDGVEVRLGVRRNR
jgi:isoleucyl-tRNA synthetase